jgi:hypothetical protein
VHEKISGSFLDRVLAKEASLLKQADFTGATLAPAPATLREQEEASWNGEPARQLPDGTPNPDYANRMSDIAQHQAERPGVAGSTKDYAAWFAQEQRNAEEKRHGFDSALPNAERNGHLVRAYQALARADAMPSRAAQRAQVRKNDAYANLTDGAWARYNASAAGQNRAFEQQNKATGIARGDAQHLTGQQAAMTAQRTPGVSTAGVRQTTADDVAASGFVGANAADAYRDSVNKGKEGNVAQMQAAVATYTKANPPTGPGPQFAGNGIITDPRYGSVQNKSYPTYANINLNPQTGAAMRG